MVSFYDFVFGGDFTQLLCFLKCHCASNRMHFISSVYFPVNSEFKLEGFLFLFGYFEASMFLIYLEMYGPCAYDCMPMKFLTLYISNGVSCFASFKFELCIFTLAMYHSSHLVSLLLSLLFCSRCFILLCCL